MRARKSRLSIRGSDFQLGSAKDPNETLKFAIGAYFSDPSNSVVLSSTKKMMGSLMFSQEEGAGEWSEKRLEQVRLQIQAQACSTMGEAQRS